MKISNQPGLAREMMNLQARQETTHRILERIRESVGFLREDASNLPPAEHERKAFRLAAADGAEKYAGDIQGLLDAQVRVGDLDLQRAALVSQAAACAGWLSRDGLSKSDMAIMKGLIAGGVFAYHPAVPDRWVSCYRLVAPSSDSSR